jgi:hypothetical protein
VRSYRTVSPLPVRTRQPEGRGVRHRRSVLCGTFLRVAPTGCYPASCPAESGRSSAGSLAGPDAAIRPTRHRFHCYLRPAVDASLRPGRLRPPVGPIVTYGRRWMRLLDPGWLRPPVGSIVTYGRRWMLRCDPAGCGLRLAPSSPRPEYRRVASPRSGVDPALCAGPLNSPGTRADCEGQRDAATRRPTPGGCAQ